MSLLLLFKYSDETLRYFNLSTLTMGRSNEVLGLMQPNATTYCRVCISKLRIAFENMKYITYRHTLSDSYICDDCGNKITKDNILNRYYRVNYVGRRKRGY